MSLTRLGAVVRRLRAARHMTQQELAKKARISQAYLSRLEAGEKKNPGIHIAQRLAKALGVPVTALLA
jgi:transcriptional regulator with XRE-family HTH domain